MMIPIWFIPLTWASRYADFKLFEFECFISIQLNLWLSYFMYFVFIYNSSNINLFSFFCCFHHGKCCFIFLLCVFIWIYFFVYIMVSFVSDIDLVAQCFSPMDEEGKFS